MKISLNWLSQYIDLKDYKESLDKLYSLLTKTGLEIENKANPAQHWKGVVVGKLLKVDKHPNADKLTLCQVEVGESKALQIVCGAKNHREGDFVAVATVGTKLPGNFKIKKTKIRGAESFGMLCSEQELGLEPKEELEQGQELTQGQDQGQDKKFRGIMILKGDLFPGQNFTEACPTDIILEINVTPNRADCLSHIGLARELSTLLDRPVKKPEVKLNETGKEINDWIEVEVTDTESCPRYCGRVISGVKVGPSPPWLKEALQSIGLKSINNVVDVTNYVLFEYGQPLHAFDYREINNSKITVDKAGTGETFVTLDETEVKLCDQDLVIRDGQENTTRIVALAGIVGGKNSGITENTRDIFLESAFFRAEGVRRTARSQGLETDSCYRFSRGVDPAQTLNAMNRAASLIQQVAGGEIQRGSIDIHPQPLISSEISISVDYVSERLGYPVEGRDFQSWMERLGCEVKKSDGNFKILPPTYRWDLSIKEDLIEEYARLHGYDATPELFPCLMTEPTNHVSSFQFNHHIREVLVGLGLNESVNHAFIGRDECQKIWTSKDIPNVFGLKMSDSPIELVNPINEELPVMRESLLPSLLKNMVFNHHHGNHYGRLFEISPIQYQVQHQKKEGFCEQTRLSLVFWGQVQGLWSLKKDNQVIYELKSVVESLLKSSGDRKWHFETVSRDQCPGGFHPGQSLSLAYGGQPIGFLGSMHPALKEENKIRTQVAWAEFNLDGLQKRQVSIQKFKALPKYPAVERDVAFLAYEKLEARTISLEIKKTAGPLLTHCEVFDVYQDKELKATGHKSMAFRLRFQSQEETLSDERVNGLHSEVIQSVCKKLGLEIR